MWSNVQVAGGVPANVTTMCRGCVSGNTCVPRLRDGWVPADSALWRSVPQLQRSVALELQPGEDGIARVEAGVDRHVAAAGALGAGEPGIEQGPIGPAAPVIGVGSGGPQKAAVAACLARRGRKDIRYGCIWGAWMV